MIQRKVFDAAGAAVLTAGLAFGASTMVAASSGKPLQLADAAQMAAVKERQDTMKDIGRNMKTIADFLKESKGTAAEAQAAAAQVNELAGTIPAVFETEATLEEMDAVGKNRGKPAIWSNWEEFTQAAETLEEKSGTLVTAFEGSDASAIQAAFADMGKNACGACHDEFRGPKVE